MQKRILIIYYLLLITCLFSCRSGAYTFYIDREENPLVCFAEEDGFVFFDGHIVVCAEPLAFARGDVAFVEITGRPYTEYNLSVILASGASRAAGLGVTKSDGDGNASWSWRVASNTRPGTVSAVIIGDGDRVVLDIVIFE